MRPRQLAAIALLLLVAGCGRSEVGARKQPAAEKVATPAEHEQLGGAFSADPQHPATQLEREAQAQAEAREEMAHEIRDAVQKELEAQRAADESIRRTEHEINMRKSMIEWERDQYRSLEVRFGLLPEVKQGYILNLKRRADNGEELAMYDMATLAQYGTAEEWRTLNERILRQGPLDDHQREQHVLKCLYETRPAVHERWNYCAPAYEQSIRWAEADQDEESRDYWQQQSDELKVLVDGHKAAIEVQEARVKNALAAYKRDQQERARKEYEKWELEQNRP